MDSQVIKNRDQLVEDYLRYYRLRNPKADTSEGSSPWLDAIALADQLLPVYTNIQRMGNAIGLDNVSGTQLDEILHDEGIAARSGAVGSSGAVILTTSSGGANVFSGDTLLEPNSRLRFTFMRSELVLSGKQTAIYSNDTGTATNLPAGTVLQISNPRPGCSPVCVVAKQVDGSGLSGGAPAENDESVRARIRYERANRGASGNPADYIKEIGKTPNVPVEQAFVYMNPLGPGTVAATFTVAGDSRSPNGNQLDAVLAHLNNVFPDIKYVVPILDQPADLCVLIALDGDIARWENVVPWPRYLPLSPSSGSASIMMGGTDALGNITLSAHNNDYSTCGSPSVGTTFGVVNPATKRLVRKKIATIAGSGPWTITLDTSFGASDMSYTPQISALIMPWTDIANTVVDAVEKYMRGMGPSELMIPPGYGGDISRKPPISRGYPCDVTIRMLSAVEAVAGVDSALFAAGGVAASPLYMQPAMVTFGSIMMFPQ